MEAKIYTTSSCPWCTRTKKWLEEKNVEYKEVDVSQDREAAKEMINVSGQRGVPVTVIGEDVITGFDREKLRQAIA